MNEASPEHAAQNLAAPTRKVRICLSATIACSLAEVAAVPADATEDELQDFARERYDQVEAGRFTLDGTWERGDCYCEAADPEDEPTLTVGRDPDTEFLQLSDDATVAGAGAAGAAGADADADADADQNLRPVLWFALKGDGYLYNLGLHPSINEADVAAEAIAGPTIWVFEEAADQWRDVLNAHMPQQGNQAPALWNVLRKVDDPALAWSLAHGWVSTGHDRFSQAERDVMSPVKDARWSREAA